MPQQNEFRRKRTATLIEKGVHAIGIGVQPGERVLGKMGDARLGEAIKAEQAHETIGGQRIASSNLSKTTSTHPALKLHLPESVLSVDIALREEDIEHALATDMRDRMAIADDLDGTIEVFHQLLAVENGQALAQPDVTGSAQNQRQQEKPEQPVPGPAKRSSHNVGRPSPSTVSSRAYPCSMGASPKRPVLSHLPLVAPRGMATSFGSRLRRPDRGYAAKHERDAEGRNDVAMPLSGL